MYTPYASISYMNHTTKLIYKLKTKWDETNKIPH